MQYKLPRSEFATGKEIVDAISALEPDAVPDTRPATIGVMSEESVMTSLGLSLFHYRDEEGWEDRWEKDVAKLKEPKALRVIQKLVAVLKLPWPSDITFGMVEDCSEKPAGGGRPIRHTIIASANWFNDSDAPPRVKREVVHFPFDRKKGA